MPAKIILLIDDDPSVTTLLASQLDTVEGIKSNAINDPKLALSTARTVQPDLIVCDIDMGATDGGSVAFALRNDPKTEGIPILFLSSMVTQDDMGETAHGYMMISKKIGFVKILAIILEKVSRP